MNPSCRRPYSRVPFLGATILAVFLTQGSAQGQGRFSFYTPWTVSALPPFQCQTSTNGTTQGTPVQGCPVTIVVTADPNTNAHLHNVNRPHSQVSPASAVSDASGNVYLTLTTTLVGQTECLLASTSMPGTMIWHGLYCYNVGYSDLLPRQSANWFLIGGSDTGGGTGHGTTADNHYMTSATYSMLLTATTGWLGYLKLTGATGGAPNSDSPNACSICPNDAALPYGGKFDIAQNWIGSHVEHDRGSAVDIAAGPAAATWPNVNKNVKQGCPYWIVDTTTFVDYCVVGGAQSSHSFAEPLPSPAFPNGCSDYLYNQPGYTACNHVHCNTLTPAPGGVATDSSTYSWSRTKSNLPLGQ